MCKSIAEGGQRCAAHTRPAAEAVIEMIQSGNLTLTSSDSNALADYASTPSGAAHLTQLKTDAEQREATFVTATKLAMENADVDAVKSETARMSHEIVTATVYKVALDAGAARREAAEQTAAMVGQPSEPDRASEIAAGDRTLKVGDTVAAFADADGQGMRFDYKVVKRTPANVTLRMVRADGSLGESKTLRVQDRGGNEYVKLNKYLHAFLRAS